MNENKDTDSKESGEYEDDFEKDLEWLINEKEIDASIMEVYMNCHDICNSYIRKVLCMMESFHMCYVILKNFFGVHWTNIILILEIRELKHREIKCVLRHGASARTRIKLTFGAKMIIVN